MMWLVASAWRSRWTSAWSAVTTSARRSGGGAGDGVNDVAGGGAAHEFAGGVGLLFGQVDDFASAQQLAQLDLGGGAAELGDDGGGDDGDDPGFELDRA